MNENTAGIATHTKASMYLSHLNDIICFRNSEIEYDHLLEIRDKCKRIRASLDQLIINRDELCNEKGSVTNDTGRKV